MTAVRHHDPHAARHPPHEPQPRRQPPQRVVHPRPPPTPVRVVEHLGLVGGHVHAGRAVGEAGPAGQAQVERLEHVGRAPAVRRQRPRRHLLEQPRPAPGGVALLAGRPVAGAHRRRHPGGRCTSPPRCSARRPPADRRRRPRGRATAHRSRSVGRGRRRSASERQRDPRGCPGSARPSGPTPPSMPGRPRAAPGRTAARAARRAPVRRHAPRSACRRAPRRGRRPPP